MTSERSKRRDFLALLFISKSISRKLLIKTTFLWMNLDLKYCPSFLCAPGHFTVFCSLPRKICPLLQNVCFTLDSVSRDKISTNYQVIPEEVNVIY